MLFLKNKKGQAITEFVILLPFMAFFLLAMMQFGIIAIKSQKLEMGAYYASRLYSKEIRRGIKSGTVMQLYDKKQAVLDEIVIPAVKAYLKTDDVEVKTSEEDSNTLLFSWPLTIDIGIGKYSFQKDIILTAKAAMQNETLEYGGGKYYETFVE